MPYTTMLLDLDHTLFDSDRSEREAFERTMLSVGADPAQLFAAYIEINTALWAAVERHELRPDDVRILRFEQFVARTGIEADPQAMAETFIGGLASFGELYPGARAVLAELAGRARLALVTNGISEVQRARIARLDIGSYFEAVVISAEVGTSKPAPAFFDVAFELLGHPAKHETLMVGDSLTADVQGGAGYGVRTCWYNPKGRAAGDAPIFDHEITSLHQLPGLAATGQTS